MENRVKQRFRAQRIQARERGIEFKFTFEEWVHWWETKLGLDWMKLRGRNRGQYQMGRKLDKGCYEWDNVICITVGENVAYSNHRMWKSKRKPFRSVGEQRPAARLTNEQAIEIFLSPLTRKAAAKKYGISKGTVTAIRARTSWKTITEDLLNRVKYKRGIP